MKKLIAVILALTMVFAMAAMAHADGYTAEEEAEAEAYHIDLIYSNVFNPKEWNYKAAEKFAEMVTERTEGHVKVEFHGLNELDCYRDSVVHAVNGDKWIGLEEPSLFADWVGDCAVLVHAACGLRHVHPLHHAGKACKGKDHGRKPSRRGHL